MFIFYLKWFLLSLHYGVLFLIFEGFFLSRKVEIQRPSPLSMCLAKQHWLYKMKFFFGRVMSHTYWHVEVIGVYVDAMSRYHMKMRFLFCLAMPRIRYYYCGKFLSC